VVLAVAVALCRRVMQLSDDNGLVHFFSIKIFIIGLKLALQN
jgi:hypothetical protein